MKAFSQPMSPYQVTQGSVKLTKQASKPNQRNVEHLHGRRTSVLRTMQNTLGDGI